MIEENAATSAIIPKSATDNSIGHDDRNRVCFVFRTRWFDEQPLRRREPLVRPQNAIQVDFQFSAVDLAIGVLRKADAKASQRFFDRLQYTSQCCEARMASRKPIPSSKSG